MIKKKDLKTTILEILYDRGNKSNKEITDVLKYYGLSPSTSTISNVLKDLIKNNLILKKSKNEIKLTINQKGAHFLYSITKKGTEVISEYKIIEKPEISLDYIMDLNPFNKKFVNFFYKYPFSILLKNPFDNDRPVKQIKPPLFYYSIIDSIDSIFTADELHNLDIDLYELFLNVTYVMLNNPLLNYNVNNEFLNWFNNYNIENEGFEYLKGKKIIIPLKTEQKTYFFFTNEHIFREIDIRLDNLLKIINYIVLYPPYEHSLKIDFIYFSSLLISTGISDMYYSIHPQMKYDNNLLLMMKFILIIKVRERIFDIIDSYDKQLSIENNKNTLKFIFFSNHNYFLDNLINFLSKRQDWYNIATLLEFRISQINNNGKDEIFQKLEENNFRNSGTNTLKTLFREAYFIKIFRKHNYGSQIITNNVTETDERKIHSLLIDKTRKKVISSKNFDETEIYEIIKIFLDYITALNYPISNSDDSTFKNKLWHIIKSFEENCKDKDKIDEIMTSWIKSHLKLNWDRRYYEDIENFTRKYRLDDISFARVHLAVLYKSHKSSELDKFCFEIVQSNFGIVNILKLITGFIPTNLSKEFKPIVKKYDEMYKNVEIAQILIKKMISNPKVVKELENSSLYRNWFLLLMGKCFFLKNEYTNSIVSLVLSFEYNFIRRSDEKDLLIFNELNYSHKKNLEFFDNGVPHIWILWKIMENYNIEINFDEIEKDLEIISEWIFLINLENNKKSITKNVLNPSKLSEEINLFLKIFHEIFTSFKKLKNKYNFTFEDIVENLDKISINFNNIDFNEFYYLSDFAWVKWMKILYLLINKRFDILKNELECLIANNIKKKVFQNTFPLRYLLLKLYLYNNNFSKSIDLIYEMISESIPVDYPLNPPSDYIQEWSFEDFTDNREIISKILKNSKDNLNLNDKLKLMFIVDYYIYRVKNGEDDFKINLIQEMNNLLKELNLKNILDNYINQANNHQNFVTSRRLE